MAQPPQVQDKGRPEIGAAPGQRHSPPGMHQRPQDLVFFGLSRKGEEFKPFLLSVPPVPPAGPRAMEEKDKPGQQRRSHDGSPDMGPQKGPGQPPAPHGFLGIDGEGHVVSNVEVTFEKNEDDPQGQSIVKSIRATVLDAAPLAVDPTEMQRKPEEERQEIMRGFEEKLRDAKEIGALQLTFTLRRDLKAPNMMDIGILTGEGEATINGDVSKLLFIAPPPAPKPGRRVGQHPDAPEPAGDEPPAPPGEAAQN